MSFPDLRSFIDQLRRERDLVEVVVPVDARFEAAEIHRRVIAAGGPALLFTNVKGADFPLVTNLFGTAGRAERAFGRRPLRLVRRIVELAQTLVPPTAGKLWGARDVLREGLRIGTRRRGNGPVRQCIDSPPDLTRLPALTCWHEDGGPFVTLPLVYTEHPTTGIPNLGMYRLQVHGPDTTGMHWQIGKGGGFHYAVAEAAGDALPVTVFLGGPPALILSAIAPLPENVPEMMLASLIAGQRLGLCTGPGEHALVANAEFALCGRVAPGERRPEGQVQVAPGGFMRSYGNNPYAGYDSSPRPFLYGGEMPEGIAPLARVVRVGDQAFGLHAATMCQCLRSRSQLSCWQCLWPP